MASGQNEPSKLRHIRLFSCFPPLGSGRPGSERRGRILGIWALYFLYVATYDDRLLQVLLSIKSKILKSGDSFDFRELILQKSSRVAAHGSKSRPKPQELINNFYVDNSRQAPKPTGLIIFDDVLVTGATFVAMRELLVQYYPDIPIFGFFLARNVWGANPDLPQS